MVYHLVKMVVYRMLYVWVGTNYAQCECKNEKKNKNQPKSFCLLVGKVCHWQSNFIKLNKCFRFLQQYSAENNKFVASAKANIVNMQWNN